MHSEILIVVASLVRRSLVTELTGCSTDLRHDDMDKKIGLWSASPVWTKLTTGRSVCRVSVCFWCLFFLFLQHLALCGERGLRRCGGAVVFFWVWKSDAGAGDRERGRRGGRRRRAASCSRKRGIEREKKDDNNKGKNNRFINSFGHDLSQKSVKKQQNIKKNNNRVLRMLMRFRLVCHIPQTLLWQQPWIKFGP